MFRRASSACSSGPVIPGMRTSNIKQPVMLGCKISKKFSALANVLTVKPTESSCKYSESRTALSSSMIKGYVTLNCWSECMPNAASTIARGDKLLLLTRLVLMEFCKRLHLLSKSTEQLLVCLRATGLYHSDLAVALSRAKGIDQVLFWNTHDLEKKLDAFKDYYNGYHVHTALDGEPPLSLSGNDVLDMANINECRWKSHCRDLFQTPMTA